MWCFCDVHLLFLGKYLSLPPPQGARSRELEFLAIKQTPSLPFPMRPSTPQGKHEFMNDVVSLRDLSSEEEIHHFKNESLGMAFLHLCHLALCRGVPLEEMAREIR